MEGEVGRTDFPLALLWLRPTEWPDTDEGQKELWARRPSGGSEVTKPLGPRLRIDLPTYQHIWGPFGDMFFQTFRASFRFSARVLRAQGALDSTRLLRPCSGMRTAPRGVSSPWRLTILECQAPPVTGVPYQPGLERRDELSTLGLAGSSDPGGDLIT